MPKYGSDSMSMRTSEAATLNNMMHSLGLSNLPKPGELHASHPEFLRFSHRSFSNVYNNIKSKMQKGDEHVPPDSDEEEEGESEIALVFYQNLRKTHLFSFFIRLQHNFAKSYNPPTSLE